MASNNFWIPLQQLEELEEKRVVDLKNQGHLIQSKKLTKRSMVMVDSNGDSKEAGSQPHSSLDSGPPRSKGSDKNIDNKNGDPGDELEIEVQGDNNTNPEEGKAVETEEELSALFNPYLPIKMFVKQRSSFVCWQVFVCMSQMITTWIGFTTFNIEQDFLGCSPDGHVWVYLRGWGDFFITFHIVMVFF
jgi:hypothetical protein